MKNPYKINPAFVKKSPFSSIAKIKETLENYKNGQKIGFTYLASLKAMGLIPRVDGSYQLGTKYSKRSTCGHSNSE